MSSIDLDALRCYDTPTICNAIEVFNVRQRHNGSMDARIAACFPDLPPMVGYASTATFRTASPPPDDAVALHEQVETFGDLPGPAVVVFQDLDQPSAAASFGDIMCSTYKAFGAAGIVTSGAGRDLEQVRAVEFPAFSDGTIASHGYRHTLHLNVPVHVGGVTVRPGDLLHGDANGVTTIPLDIASELPDACAVYAAAEEIVLAYTQSGSVTPKGLREARAECSARIADLTNRLSR